MKLLFFLLLFFVFKLLPTLWKKKKKKMKKTNKKKTMCKLFCDKYKVRGYLCDFIRRILFGYASPGWLDSWQVSCHRCQRVSLWVCDSSVERHSFRQKKKKIPELVLTVGPNTDFNVDIRVGGQQTDEPTSFLFLKKASAVTSFQSSKRRDWKGTDVKEKPKSVRKWLVSISKAFPLLSNCC